MLLVQSSLRQLEHFTSSSALQQRWTMPAGCLTVLVKWVWVQLAVKSPRSLDAEMWRGPLHVIDMTNGADIMVPNGQLGWCHLGSHAAWCAKHSHTAGCLTVSWQSAAVCLQTGAVHACQNLTDLPQIAYNAVTVEDAQLL